MVGYMDGVVVGYMVGGDGWYCGDWLYGWCCGDWLYGWCCSDWLYGWCCGGWLYGWCCGGWLYCWCGGWLYGKYKDLKFVHWYMLMK